MPLALLFAGTRGGAVSLDAARRATQRFSVLGTAAVATLIATGIVAGWIIVGTIPGLIGTAMGACCC